MVLERSHQVLAVFIEHAVSVQAATVETLKKAMQAAVIQEGQQEESLSKRSMMEFKLWQILNFTYENHARIGLDCPGLVVSLRVLTWCVTAYNLLSNERPGDLDERRMVIIRQAKLHLHHSAALTGDVEQGNTVKLNEILLGYWLKKLVNLPELPEVDLATVDICADIAAAAAKDAQQIAELSAQQAAAQQALWATDDTSTITSLVGVGAKRPRRSKIEIEEEKRRKADKRELKASGAASHCQEDRDDDDEGEGEEGQKEEA